MVTKAGLTVPRLINKYEMEIVSAQMKVSGVNPYTKTYKHEG